MLNDRRTLGFRRAKRATTVAAPVRGLAHLGGLAERHLLNHATEALAKPSRAERTGGGTAASCGASAPLRPACVVLRLLFFA